MESSFKLIRSQGALWSLTVLASTPLLACTPGEAEEGFRVTTVDYDGDAILTLTFSKPVANADAVDPNDFRLSVGQTSRSDYGGNYATAYTQYMDVAIFGYSYAAHHSFMSVSQGASPNELVLEMSEPLGTEVCDVIDDTLAYFEMYVDPDDVDMTMLVHYAGGSIPLQSEEGETLADIGPDWVLSDESYVTNESFGFPSLNPVLRVPCP